MRTKQYILSCLLLALSLFILSSCGSSDTADNEEKTISEGVDTKCEITSYHDYEGRYISQFLKKGDKVAVISPSALPSKEQKDATIKGLKKWGWNGRSKILRPRPSSVSAAVMVPRRSWT